MEIIRRNKLFIRQTVLVTLANLVVAVVINLLAWQFSLISGGLTGYAIFINWFTKIPVGTLLLALNIGLILLTLIVAGKGPGIKAVYGFATLSVFIDLSRSILNLVQKTAPTFLTSLLLILTLSIIMGAAVSVVLANDYSVGAYSTLYILVKKFFDIPAQNVFFIMDFVLALLTGIFLGIDKGILLVVNAFVAYFVVRLLLPKCKNYFENLGL